MSSAGMVGAVVTCAAVVGTLVLAALRTLLLPWCPECDGRGGHDVGTRALACDVCSGTGVFRVPDTAPADWFTAP